MVFEAVLTDEARAVVSIAIDRLVSAPRRFATKIQAREALNAAIAVELSGPFVALLWTTSPGALGDAIQRRLGNGKKNSVGRLWLEAQIMPAARQGARERLRCRPGRRARRP